MKLIKKLNIISISNNELKVSVCKKQKYTYYLDSAVELAESFFMELQVCQFEALEERYDKAKQTELKAMF